MNAASAAIGSIFVKRDSAGDTPERLRLVGWMRGGPGGQLIEPVLRDADEHAPAFACDLAELEAEYQRASDGDPVSKLNTRLDALVNGEWPAARA